MTIPTANLGFSTSPSMTKLTSGDCNNDRQLELAIWAFCLPISQFLAGRCRNHLANPLSSPTSSKIANLAWELRRYLSQFQRCNYFRFGAISTFLVVGYCCTYLPTLFYTCNWSYILQCRWNFKCTVRSLRDISISGCGRHFLLSLIIGIAWVHFL